MRGKAASSTDNIQGQLDKLQSKYRMMELNKKTMNSETTSRMQRRQIAKLKKDNERLKEDLSLETRQAKQANNMSASAQIAKLQDQADLYSRKIEQERRRLEHLDREVNKFEKEAAENRQKMGGINASTDASRHIQKRIVQWENRLDKAKTKFNEAQAHNKLLMETITNLRRERTVFDGITQKLKNELHEKRNKMAEIIEISNAAYEARDKAQLEMMSLKKEADKEQQKFEVEWSQLGQLIEKDRKMKEFMKGRDRERSLDDGNSAALEEEHALRKRVERGAIGITKDKFNIHQSMEKVQSYEEAFATMQKATKITDIDELVQTFINAEDQNFSLFNYVNDLSNEIEAIEEDTTKIKAEIKLYQTQQVAGDQDRRKIIGYLQNEVGNTDTRAAAFEEHHQKGQSTVESIKKGIQSIFDKVGCTDEKALEILGNAGVTENNLMSYLGVIEQRTNQLLEIYTQHRKKEGEKFDESPLGEPVKKIDEGEEGGEAGGEEEAAAPAEPTGELPAVSEEQEEAAGEPAEAAPAKAEDDSDDDANEI